jgi:hypothetical protein
VLPVVQESLPRLAAFCRETVITFIVMSGPHMFVSSAIAWGSLLHQVGCKGSLDQRTRMSYSAALMRLANSSTLPISSKLCTLPSAVR